MSYLSRQIGKLQKFIDKELVNHISRKLKLEESIARSQVYLFLSRAFLFPQEPVQAFWKDGCKGLELLDGSLYERCKCLWPPPLEEMARHYIDVFTHTSPQEYPPYETEYGNKNTFQQAHILSTLGGFYRAWGLQTARGERLDHIGIELEFLYFLTYKEAYSLSQKSEQSEALALQGHEAQVKFFSEHLAKWGLPFMRSIKEKTKGYYSDLAGLALDFLFMEKEYLGLQSGLEEFPSDREQELTLLAEKGRSFCDES